MSTDAIPDWKRLHDRATVVDLHAHPASKAAFFLRTLSKPHRRSSRFFDPFSLRTDFDQLRAGGVDVLVSTVVIPEKQMLNDFALPLLGRIPLTAKLVLDLIGFFARRGGPRTGKSDGSNFGLTCDVLDMMERQAQQANVAGKRGVEFAHSVAELDALLERGDDAPIALIHAVEGAHSLEGLQITPGDLLANLQTLFDRGVAYLTLAHFYENEVVAPVFPFPEPNIAGGLARYVGRYANDLTRGLSATGEQIVERMVELGMIIDISHCTPTARKQIFDLVDGRACITATHIGTYEINPTPYNLKDWEVKEIARSGGVVGVIFMNYWLVPFERQLGLTYITKTIEHFVNVGGVDHVAIGSDFDGFTDPPDDLSDASDMPHLTARLLATYQSRNRRKFGEQTVEKILGTNVLRMLRECWGKRE